MSSLNDDSPYLERALRELEKYEAEMGKEVTIIIEEWKTNGNSIISCGTC